MDFFQLEQIIAIGDAASASQAASHLGVSQSSLSRSMRRLEAELGNELFNRTCNSMELNEAGALAYEFAKRALRELHILKNELASLVDCAGTVRIGSVAPAPLLKFVSELIEQNHNVLITPTIMKAEDIYRALLNRDIDYGITLSPIDLPPAESKPIMDERLFAYVPKSSTYAQRQTVSFAELNGESFVVPGGIGFWLDVLGRNLPDSKLVVQSNTTVFQQMIAISDSLMFTTDSPYAEYADRRSDNRVAVPLIDADAVARYYLSARK